MLTGQLPLTDRLHPAAGGVRFSRCATSVAIVGLLLLAGCASRGTRAPVVDISPGQQSATAQPGGTYVVKPGDSLYRIARTYNLDIENLKRWNNLTDPNQISVGQVLKLSGSASAPAAPSGAVPAPKPPQPEPVPLGEPGAPATTTPPAATTPPPATPPAPAEPPPSRAADAGVINWGWPATGAVMQKFSAATKGIDIAGTPGDPVVAAADGKVMYSGNGVRGLGNLIIINHQNGFITAYAHNRALLVKTGQDVKRGAKIAELGQSDAASPRLHFEIRRQGTPVDPLQYLPSR
ncbi:peptidoglycan DD-metalloendopeptidase family protein [Bordetella sp. 2513F-2]